MVELLKARKTTKFNNEININVKKYNNNIILKIIYELQHPEYFEVVRLDLPYILNKKELKKLLDGLNEVYHKKPKNKYDIINKSIDIKNDLTIDISKLSNNSIRLCIFTSKRNTVKKSIHQYVDLIINYNIDDLKELIDKLTEFYYNEVND